MKATKSQSIRSYQSIRSVKSATENEKDKSFEFDDMLTNACNKFGISRIMVKKDFRVDDYLQAIKPTGPFQLKRNIHKQQTLLPSPSTEKTNESEVKSPTSSICDDYKVVTAIYDKMNKLEEIMLEKHSNTSRKLIQIIGVLAPLYRDLTKFTLKRCNLNAYTLYELSKFLSLTTITDVCLDDCNCTQANYVLLLNVPCTLVNLSLARCGISDDTCLEIASKLHYPEAAEASLVTLNLSSNRITDEGAKAIGAALRTNRHLRYLNLAGNQISDDGADRILSALIDFELTHDETMNKRRIHMSYLRIRRETYLKYYSELMDTKSVDDDSVSQNIKTAKKTAGKAKKDTLSAKPTIDPEEILRIKAENMARDFVGSYRHPFNSHTTKSIDGVVHCFGNLVLCFLNLSFNNLSYLSLKKLDTVLKHQSAYKKLGELGLLRVSIDGNNLPSASYLNEFFSIECMLSKNVILYSPRYNAEGRRKSKGRISVPEKILKR